MPPDLSHSGFEKEVHDRLVNLETSVGAIVSQFPVLIERQTDMVGRLVRIEERLAARANATDMRLDRVSSDVHDHESRIRALETSTQGVDQFGPRITDLERGTRVVQNLERLFWVCVAAIASAYATGKI